jgi:uncharacterized repeat protein (TIGR01451 family)
MEVDESGHHPGRGYVDLGKRGAVSYTNYFTHQMTRGNLDPKDDFKLNPGQTWCVITSPVEGDTHLTVYAPGISNWDQRKKVVTVRWIDASWIFPPDAQVPAGTQHVLTTQILRHTNKEPLANYRVRYRIVDGPPAVLVPSMTQEAFVTSDLKGNAQVAIAQKLPAQGINTVEVEIIRPPDPTQPSGSGITVAKALTRIEWLAPSVALTHTGPPAATLGQEIPYMINVTNTGKGETQSMTVTNPIPPGLLYVRSDPPAFLDGKTLTWAMGKLPPGQTHTIKTFFQADKPGPVNNCAAVITEEGLKDEKCVLTDINEALLKVNVTGPTKAVVGETLNFTVTLENPGSGPASNVTLTGNLSEGLESLDVPPEEKATRVINYKQAVLKPLEQKVIPLKVVPLAAGKQTIQVSAVADGGLKAEAPVAVIDVISPKLGVSLSGPKKKYVDRPAEWNITVTNNSDIALNNVLVRDVLPPQLIFESATEGGNLNEKTNEVTWDIGMLKPGQSRVLQLTTRTSKTPALVNHTVVATAADYNLQKEATASMQIEGVAALKVEAIDVGDPVEVGKQLTYYIEVSNTGSDPVSQLGVVAKLPPELKPAGAHGPAEAKTEGQTISFAKLPALEPGKTIKYEITAQAEKPGSVIFRVDFFAQGLTQPVFEEESTTIIGPATLPSAPPIAVPPVTPPGPAVLPPAPNGVSPAPGGVPPVPPPPFPEGAKPLPKF